MQYLVLVFGMTVKSDEIAGLLKNALQDSSIYLPENYHKISSVFDSCLKLFERDNICTILTNENGTLCGTYPSKIIIPLCQIDAHDHERKLDEYGEVTKLAVHHYKELAARGRLARTRGRFPVPSVLLGNKFICRSSTLAGSIEMYAQQKYQYWFPGESSQLQHDHFEENGLSHNQNSGLTEEHHTAPFNQNESNDSAANALHSVKKSSKNPLKLLKFFTRSFEDDDQNEWLLQKTRKTDIDVLHRLKVNVICDLMVENKKAKYGIYVTSSEKVDRWNRYSDFEVISIPYPGCEFFTDYSRNKYVCSGLKFDWNQSFIDAKLQVPDNDISKIIGVDWSGYTDWDLMHLTRNYLKLMLNCLISSNSSGILVHCISGWDRTPLFVSLLRLLLWADGLVHQSLNAEEIIYLTLAYDWLMFNHQFHSRIYKSEEIMHFCFEFLRFLDGEEYSLLPLVQSLESPFIYCDNKTVVNGSSDMPGISGMQPFKVPEEKQASNAFVDQSSTASHNDDVKACLDFVVSTVVTKADPEISSQIENLNMHNESDIESSNVVTPNSNQPCNLGVNDGNVSESLLTLRRDSLNRSNAFTSSNASLNSGCVGFSNKEEKIRDVLKLKLKKREEKLSSARKIFLSAYSVVQDQKDKMLQRSGFSTYVGSWGASLVNFVKRT